MRALVPIPFAAPGGPGLVAVHPKLNSTVVVAAPQGHFQIVDTGNPGEGVFNQIQTGSYITCLDISPSGDFLAFGEADGSVRLWSSSSDTSALRFNNFESDPPEAADVPEELPSINWTPNTPLSTIGLPYYKEPLLSYTSYDFYGSESSLMFRPAAKIDSVVLSTMRNADGLGYSPLPKHLRGKRNVVLDRSRGKDRRRIGMPLFRSEQEREAAKKGITLDTSKPQSPSSPIAVMSEANEMPAYYSVQNIQYSKFGIEDFDFGFYNKTPFSGLETHIQNSYANAYLQMLHYLRPIRTLAISHIAQDCERENCLLCEAGFLFKMLESAKGSNCQATNFLRAFGNLPRTAALGLLDQQDSPSAEAAYANLAQNLNRYMLDTMSEEAALQPDKENFFRKAVAIVANTKTTCNLCSATTERESISYATDLTYPRKALSNEAALPTDFASVLRNSLLRPTSTKSMCRSCRNGSAILSSRRHFTSSKDLPVVLTVNAAVHTEETLAYWVTPSRRKGDTKRPYLPIGVDMTVDGQGSLSVKSVWEDEEPVSEGAVRYVLRGMVAQIQGEKDAPHLVALQRINEDEVPEGKSSWYLFNDFLVRSVSDTEARSISGAWKIPSVLSFERKDAAQALDLSKLPTEIDTSILFKDLNVSRHRDPKLQKHKFLRKEEKVGKGTLIAIDSEFVALSQEETEVRSDGTRSLIRPTRLSLARVSVIRGEGDLTNTPFIDDHIFTREPVVDYLTQFSGIVHGDLDPETSRHTLVPLKTAYKKLRLLVDLGCSFIGHGLSKDFRIINIHVPKDQVIDTVDLYHSASHPRKLSLRFLSWFLLKRDIQSGTAAEGHDSVEDASAALQLYKLYQQFEADDRIDDVMEDLYDEGRRVVSTHTFR